MKILRLIAILIALALLAYGLAGESHVINSRDGGAPQTVSGSGFIQGAAADRYQRKDGKLYDTLSKQVPPSASLDDCPT